MINLLDMEKQARLLEPVTTSEFTIGKSNAFHPGGLFSEVIFGAKDSIDRKKTYSYINLHCKIVHPALVKPLSRLNKKIILAISQEAAYKWDEKAKIMVEDKEGDINGVSSVIKNFDKFLTRKEEQKTRIDIKNMIYSYHTKNMLFIDKCIVIPAGYRDASVDEVRGGLRVNPLNDYYVRIIRQALQLESFSVKEGQLYDILSAKMQFLVNELYDNLIEKISKKQGLVRQSILGKRVDFSGRAVVTGGSDSVKVDEIGVPFKMLVKLFEPFILYDITNTKNVDQELFGRLLYEYNESTFGIPAIRSVLTMIQKGHNIPPLLEDMIKASVSRAIQGKVVLAKRDPALHAESVQGFKPIMVDGDTLRLNPLKCAGYNADFDGDQMALYVPLTKEAIQQVKDKMITSESKDSINGISDDFSKDIIIGLYCLTQDPVSKATPITIQSDNELATMNPLTPIKYDGVVTTVGRVVFNKRMPNKKFWISKPMNKSAVKELALSIYKEYYHKDKTVYVEFCHACVELGMRYYTIMAPSFGMDDILDVPKDILDLKDKLKNAKTLQESNQIQEDMEKRLKKYLEDKNTNIGVIGKAGGLKSGYRQIRQILVAKGLIQTLDKSLKQIDASYSDGLTSSEFFESGYGSRAGIVDRVINTSDTGYLSRRLVFALQRVEANNKIHDCGTSRFFTLKATPDIAKRLSGRYILDKNMKVIPFNSKDHLNKIIRLRSPLYCRTVQLCKTCYGDLLDRNGTNYVGILAGEICGERLTQTIMRTFHVGGAVSIKTFDIMTSLTKIMEDDEKKFFSMNFKQDGNKLIAQIDGKIVIDLGLYKSSGNAPKITEKEIKMNYAYFNLMYLSYNIDVTIDNIIDIDLSDKTVSRKDDIIEISFPKGSSVFVCLPTEEKFSEQVKIIDSLLSGRSPWKSPDHFCMKLYDIYSDIGTDADMVHFEVLASNLLRDSGNPAYPARLNYKNYKPVLRALDSISKLESWLQGLAFQEPSEAITAGLLYDRPSNETILEKLISGNFD